MVRDPVCGMTIDPKKAHGSAVYKGVEYYFCSPGCLADFQMQPEEYVPLSEHHHRG